MMSPPNCLQGVLLTRFWVLVRMVVEPRGMMALPAALGRDGRGQCPSLELHGGMPEKLLVPEAEARGRERGGWWGEG